MLLVGASQDVCLTCYSSASSEEKHSTGPLPKRVPRVPEASIEMPTLTECAEMFCRGGEVTEKWAAVMDTLAEDVHDPA